MSKKYDLVTLGEVLLRLSPANNERIVRSTTFEKNIGGAELNVAAGASLLGLSTSMLTVLPDSAIGIYAKNQIGFCGVGTDKIAYQNQKNARLGIYYYENGAAPRKPNVVYDRANSTMTKVSIDDFDEEIYHQTKCFHTSGITLALSKEARQTGVEMIKRFKKAGAIISFDVNFRGNLWTGEEARECIESLLPYVDIFFCSESTAQLTFKKKGTLEQMMKEFAKEYPISIVASTNRTVHSPKRHSFTSVIYNAKEDKFYEEKPYNDIEVVDRIGSGDAYCAGALYGLLSSNMDCNKALMYGNACSAVKNTIPGDMPSLDKKEIDNIIADHHMESGYQSEMNR